MPLEDSNAVNVQISNIGGYTTVTVTTNVYMAPVNGVSLSNVAAAVFVKRNPSDSYVSFAADSPLNSATAVLTDHTVFTLTFASPLDLGIESSIQIRGDNFQDSTGNLYTDSYIEIPLNVQQPPSYKGSALAPYFSENSNNNLYLYFDKRMKWASYPLETLLIAAEDKDKILFSTSTSEHPDPSTFGNNYVG